MESQMELVRPQQERNGTYWQEWGVLTAAGITAVMFGLPGLWPALTQTAEKMGQSMPAFLAFQLGSSAVQIALMVAIGLFFAHGVGLGAPILERWLNHGRVEGQFRSILVLAVGVGVLGAVTTLALDRLVFMPLLPDFTSVISQVSGWRGFLASFYGGILEELEMRLLLVSGIAWLLGTISHTAAGIPSRGAFWLSIVIVAIVFGLGHLPATSLTVAITPLVVLRAVLLNGILGVLFGTAYWKRGLEAAMLCHFSADLIVHVVFPLV